MENIKNLENYLIENKLGSETASFADMMYQTRKALNRLDTFEDTPYKTTPNVREPYHRSKPIDSCDSTEICEAVCDLIDKSYGINAAFHSINVNREKFYFLFPHLENRIKKHKYEFTHGKYKN